MTPWKLSPDGKSALRTLDDGISMESRMVESISAEELAAALPADVPTLQQQIAVNLIQIDRDVDAIYAALLGNREAEYTLAEKEALAFQAAGYAGAVPPSVQAWATAKSQTATWATDDILAAATSWRAAQLAIRANRLAGKEAVRKAVDGAALIAALAQWAGFLAVIKPQLGL